MRCISVKEINENVAQNELAFILRSEEYYHDKIVEAVSAIALRKDTCPIVLLTGPSGSGKTTTAMRIEQYLDRMGIHTMTVSMDNYFYPIQDRPAEAQRDWESPLCVNFDLLTSQLTELTNGKTVQMPVYDFQNNTTGGYRPVAMHDDTLIIVEGIHALNDRLFQPIRDKVTGIYIAPRTRIEMDGKLIEPHEIRLLRRWVRDYRVRGRTFALTYHKAESVDRGENRYIKPNKHHAMVHFDTFMDYELSAICRQLQHTPAFFEEITDAFARENNLTLLLELVRSVAPLKTDYIQNDSVVREFIGGSVLVD